MFGRPILKQNAPPPLQQPRPYDMGKIRKRQQLADALYAQGAGARPMNVGEGIAAAAQSITGGWMGRRANKQADAAGAHDRQLLASVLTGEKPLSALSQMSEPKYGDMVTQGQIQAQMPLTAAQQANLDLQRDQMAQDQAQFDQTLALKERELDATLQKLEGGGALDIKDQANLADKVRDDYTSETKIIQSTAENAVMAARLLNPTVNADGTINPTAVGRAEVGAIFTLVSSSLQSGVLTDADIARTTGGSAQTFVNDLIGYANGEKGPLTEAQVRSLYKLLDVTLTNAQSKQQATEEAALGRLDTLGIPRQLAFGTDPDAFLSTRRIDKGALIPEALRGRVQGKKDAEDAMDAFSNNILGGM